jgi:hypothetical protein
MRNCDRAGSIAIIPAKDAGSKDRLRAMKKRCQGGKRDRILLSDSEDGKYKVRKMSTLPLAI